MDIFCDKRRIKGSLHINNYNYRKTAGKGAFDTCTSEGGGKRMEPEIVSEMRLKIMINKLIFLKLIASLEAAVFLFP